VAIREGKWRCPYCGNIGRGADAACKGCGATRDKDVQFFLEDEAPEVTDAALLQQAQAGPEWLCPHCQTGNPAAAARCKSCGAERGDAKSRATDFVPPTLPPAATRVWKPAPIGPSRWKLGCAIAALLALGLGSVFAYFALRKTEESVKVTGFEWERSLDVEAYRTVRDKAWEGELPAGARVVSRSS